jgi:biotin carboxyl carrier protein
MQNFRLRVKDRTYDIGLDSEHMTVEGFGLNWAVVEALGLVRGRKAPPKKAAEPAAAAPAAVEGALTAMMPSKVISLRVQVGDRVQADQVVLVLEAMKMESELKASQNGTVTAVHCAAGDSVDPGVPLVVIEPDEE